MIEEKHPSGVKTPADIASFGTDKSVPFQNSGAIGVFQQAVQSFMKACSID
jgi:hypothetical protein